MLCRERERERERGVVPCNIMCLAREIGRGAGEWEGGGGRKTQLNHIYFQTTHQLESFVMVVFKILKDHS